MGDGDVRRALLAKDGSCEKSTRLGTSLYTSTHTEAGTSGWWGPIILHMYFLLSFFLLSGPLAFARDQPLLFARWEIQRHRESCMYPQPVRPMQVVHGPRYAETIAQQIPASAAGETNGQTRGPGYPFTTSGPYFAEYNISCLTANFMWMSRAGETTDREVCLGVPDMMVMPS